MDLSKTKPSKNVDDISKNKKVKVTAPLDMDSLPGTNAKRGDMVTARAQIPTKKSTPYNQADVTSPVMKGKVGVQSMDGAAARDKVSIDASEQNNKDIDALLDKVSKSHPTQLTDSIYPKQIKHNY